MLVDTNELPIDLAGEVLRRQCFNNQESYPCRRGLWGDFYESKNRKYWLNKFSDYLTDEKEATAHIFFNDNLTVIFQNDGDTTLIIFDNRIAYINTDAKKSYGWKKVFVEYLQSK